MPVNPSEQEALLRGHVVTTRGPPALSLRARVLPHCTRVARRPDDSGANAVGEDAPEDAEEALALAAAAARAPAARLLLPLVLVAALIHALIDLLVAPRRVARPLLPPRGRAELSQAGGESLRRRYDFCGGAGRALATAGAGALASGAAAVGDDVVAAGAADGPPFMAPAACASTAASTVARRDGSAEPAPLISSRTGSQRLPPAPSPSSSAMPASKSRPAARRCCGSSSSMCQLDRLVLASERGSRVAVAVAVAGRGSRVAGSFVVRNDSQSQARPHKAKVAPALAAREHSRHQQR